MSDICQRPRALPCGLPAAGYLAPLGSYVRTTGSPVHQPPLVPSASSEGWLYVAAILDLYSRRIVGWTTGAPSRTARRTVLRLCPLWRAISRIK